MDNRRLSEPSTPNGQPRSSTITAWLAQPTSQPLTIQLDTSGGTATPGTDYQAFPTTLVIPAGKSAASIELIPLHDGRKNPRNAFKSKCFRMRVIL